MKYRWPVVVLWCVGDSQVPAGIVGDLLSMPANVAIQVVPDQPHKLTKTDFLDILSDANREVYKVVQGIEQDLANRAEVLEKLSSSWASGGAPVFVPFRLPDVGDKVTQNKKRMMFRQRIIPQVPGKPIVTRTKVRLVSKPKAPSTPDGPVQLSAHSYQ